MEIENSPNLFFDKVRNSDHSVTEQPVTLTKALLKNPFSVRTGLRSRTSWGSMLCTATTPPLLFTAHQENVDMTGAPLFFFIQFKFSMTNRDSQADPTFASQRKN